MVHGVGRESTAWGKESEERSMCYLRVIMVASIVHRYRPEVAKDYLLDLEMGED